MYLYITNYHFLISIRFFLKDKGQTAISSVLFCCYCWGLNNRRYCYANLLKIAKANYHMVPNLTKLELEGGAAMNQATHTLCFYMGGMAN